MSKFKLKKELLEEVHKERLRLESLLDDIPKNQKLVEVIDGMSVKDFLAHRTQWGRMMTDWSTLAKNGGTPAVPSEKYKWNQLTELNAEIFDKHKDDTLESIEKDFTKVHDALYKLIEGMGEDELFDKKYYNFTGSSNLVTYLNSATASHYRSAHKHISKWWKKQL